LTTLHLQQVKKMKRTILSLIVLAVLAQNGFSQETRIYTDPQQKFWEAKEFFQQEQYSLAYPLFKELQLELRSTDYSNHRLVTEEINFYTTVCGLKQNEATAADQAKYFIALERNNALNQKMAFHLGEYYFRHNDLRNANIYYELSDISQLSNSEIAEMKFHQGYAYFTLKQFDKAKPLLNSIRQLPDNPNYDDANYYYGFISYYDRQFSDAMDAFRKVEKHPEYGKVVPFYITNILYFQGQKEKALEYAEANLKSTSSVYEVEMKQLMGHVYFEKKDFAKALTNLESVKNSGLKLNRETLYELSYSYYVAKQYQKSVDGFKQLTEGQDSLSQSAMYLLGDAYLKLGQKANARNAFAFCASNSSNAVQKEVSKFNYGKLSYELGFQDIALNELKGFIRDYPNSAYYKEARELMVGLLANTNNYREALEMLEGLQQPSDAAKQLTARVAYGRAMELIEDQNLRAAEVLLDKVIKDPYNAPVISGAHFWKGEISYRQNRTDEAIRAFNNYLAANPVVREEVNPTNAKYNLGYSYLRKENYKLAKDYFEQVVRSVRVNSSPLEQDAWLRAADCYFMSKDFAKAQNMYAQAINYSWPAADYAVYQNAMIAGVKSPNEKINALKTFERKFPGSPLTAEVNMEIANAYLADEKYKDAIPFLNQVVKAGDNAAGVKPRALLRLGIANYNLNNNAAALDNYKTLVSQYPDAPETESALESAKAIYVEEGKTSEYVAFLKSAGRSVTRNQEDSLAYAAAETRYADNDLNGALNAFNQYLQQFPDGEFSLDATYFRSEIYNGKKDWKNAVAGYEKVADRGASKYAEKASLQAARLNFFELQDYNKSEKYFQSAKSLASDNETRLDAMRGLLRSQYQLKKWSDATANAQELLKEKSLSNDDKVLAGMVLARARQNEGKYTEAIQQFRTVVSASSGAYAAEARYEIAASYLQLKDLKNAEKAAFETINKSGSYDFWITKAYILLGDVFWKQKDFFNAKATLQSVVDNSKNTELKEEAQVKLELVVEDEKATGNAQKN
jgi:TolA-binding protein